MNQISRRTIPVLIALIFAAGCDSPADPKTIAAAYPPIEATANTAITSASPVLDDSAWKGTWEAANLPEGLKINPDTGVISGTPTTESTKADYSITLTGTGDSDGVNGTAAVSIAVTPLTAAYDAIEATVGTPITEVTPIPSDTGWTGTWAANLPDGLKIAADTGAISGTPTAVSDKTDYTVTLTGTGDSEGVDGSAAVSITIMPYAPLALTAAQMKITDGTKSDGTKKFPSHFMVFDIATTDTVKTTVPVEFLLVKEGLTAPTTLEEFRKTAAITMTEPAEGLRIGYGV